MDARFESNFLIRDKTAFQSTGLMEDFTAGGGSVSASNSKIVDNSTMGVSEATTTGVDRANVSSKIGERVEIFPVRSEAITVEVSTTRTSSGIKIEEGFPTRTSFQELNRSLNCSRVSPGNVGRVISLERASKNTVTGPPN